MIIAMKDKDSHQQLLKLTEAAAILGVHFNTVRRWDGEGFLRGQRTAGGHRRYELDELLRFKKDFQDFERQGATLARKIFLNTRKNGE
jgi:excisionase family DNA binding protein